MRISPPISNPRSGERAQLPIDDAAFAQPRRCAGCGVEIDPNSEPCLPFVYFCEECRALAAPPEFEEELGVGD